MRIRARGTARGLASGCLFTLENFPRDSQNAEHLVLRADYRVVDPEHAYRMRAMLDSLRSRYPDRYLFLDGPAVKGSPDARILADLVDFVVLVAGSGRDTPGAIQKVMANFESTKLAGIVLNQLP